MVISTGNSFNQGLGNLILPFWGESHMELLAFYTKLVHWEINFYTDSKELYLFLHDIGYKCKLTDDFEFVHADSYAFCIPTSYAMQSKSNELWKHEFSQCILLLFSAIKFDNSLVSIKYTLQHFLNINFEEMLKTRAKVYKLFNSSYQLQLQTSSHAFLEVNLQNELETANFDTVLRSNWQYSIAEICEASIVNVKHDKSSFSCDGIFYFDGIIHTITNQVNKENNTHYLMNLVQSINAASEKYLIIEDNCITKLILDGQNYISSLENMKYSTFERGLSITEFAVGCNKQIQNELNWNINSVVNEAVYGTHLGIGMANKCPHIDFIKKDVIPTTKV